MLTLIHGANNLASYEALKKISDQFDELSVTKLSGANLTLDAVKEAVETPSFTGKRLVIIEDLSATRSPNFLADLKKYLPNLPAEEELIIFERKTLPPESPILKLTTRIQSFPPAKGPSVFEWADNVGSRKLAASLSGWEELLENGEEPEYLFLMLVRQFRLLLLMRLKADPKVPPFVRSRLSAQLKLWSEPQLRTVYRELLEMDYLNKTGRSPLSVTVPAFLSSVGKT
jgi:DNA polymerase III delta subunit